MLISTTSIAQPPQPNKDEEIDVQVPATCYNKDVLIEALKSDFNEVPVFSGHEDREGKKTQSFLSYNAKTRTYTFGIAIPDTEFICILSSGEGMLINLTPRSRGLSL